MFVFYLFFGQKRRKGERKKGFCRAVVGGVRDGMDVRRRTYLLCDEGGHGRVRARQFFVEEPFLEPGNGGHAEYFEEPVKVRALRVGFRGRHVWLGEPALHRGFLHVRQGHGFRHGRALPGKLEVDGHAVRGRCVGAC